LRYPHEVHAATAQPLEDSDADEEVAVSGVPWAVYVALADARGESATPRITFIDGVIDLVIPSRDRGRIKTTWGRLLELWSLVTDVDLVGLGSTTFRDELNRVGLEPDECYYVGPEREAPPDIAIEVIWRSGSLRKLEAYARLGVSEVWFWHKGAIRVFALRSDTYEEAQSSALLPSLDVGLLSEFVSHRDQMRAARAWHAVLLARMKD